MGYFDMEEEAARAYDDFVKSNFSIYYLNFPD